MPKSQRPDGKVAGSTKRLASRFYQVKTGTALPSSISSGQSAGPPLSAGGAGARPGQGTTSSRCAPSGKLSRISVGGGAEGDGEELPLFLPTPSFMASADGGE